MMPGETERFMCNQCMSEFEVCFEPKAKGSKTVGDPTPEEVDFCPFCGEEDVELA